MNLNETLSALRLVPVVVLDDADAAVPLADALAEAGLPCAEITFRTKAAAESIRRMRDRGGITLGAGTVLTVDQAKQAIDSGAEFIISPGVGPAVVEFCLKQNVPIAPGIATPTDIQLALSFGLDVLKFFPAEAYGGVKTLKALSAPFSQVRFVPTGGIDEKNVRSYLDLPCVLACGGSWMVSKDLIKQGKFDTIRDLTRSAVALARG